MKPSPSLAADALFQDARISEAKKLLIDAVAAHQKTLTHVKPPNPALKQTYDELLEKFTQYRGNKLWFPYIGSGMGNGVFVELLDGSVKYDFICGMGTHFLGHSHPEIISASIDAAISDTVMQGHLQQNRDTIELSEILTRESKLPHCFLTTSGAMANENALKIAFQKKYPAYRVLSFERCFAGRTLATTQITDKPSFREGLPQTLTVDYVPFFDPKQPAESTERTLEALKKHLQRYPKQHAVMCFELIQGEGGFHSATKEF
jgi:acetylornithine/succinyldiaminopimelate/putrescine aminotransferase